MRGINRKRALIVASTTIIMCFVIIVGMTWALFTDDRAVVNHLKAGDLDVTLVRTSLTSTYVDSNGYLATFTDTEEKDFSGATDENIFAFDGTVIVPQSKYIANMKVINNSDVSFAYWIEIVYTGAEGVELADQLKVSIDTSEGKAVREGMTIGSEESPIAVLGIGDSHDFTATVEFLDLENAINNAAQGDSITFDLIVHAVQYTGENPTSAN